jgi:gamma-glutamyl-gamma-aminobutyrate hydrolase PuuD
MIGKTTHTSPISEGMKSGDAHMHSVSTQNTRRNAGGPGGYHPIIGIPIPIQQGKQGPLLLADAVGAWAIERMGGSVFLIPLWPFPTHKHVYQSLWSLIQSIDGLLLPARVQGHDCSPRENQTEAQSWPISWELALAQLATTIGMPTLAIADGAEIWNEALGGDTVAPRGEYWHTDPSSRDPWDHHTIRVRAQSHLAFFIQQTLANHDEEQPPWELAFMHHQGVEIVAPGLRSCAQIEDGRIVAIERSDSAFGLGIIGRLDWGLDQLYAMTLFDAFLQACTSFDHLRQHHHAWEASRDTICAALYECITSGQPLLPALPVLYERTKLHSSHSSGSLFPSNRP